MSIFGAAIRGFGAALGSPKLVIGLWLVNLIVALPVAGLMGASIGNSVGGSLVDENLRDGFDMYWFGEYREEAKGIETSFTPTVTGAGAFYSNLEAWSNGRLFSEYLPLVGVGVLYGLLWSFLMGGVLDRFARPSESAVRARFAQAGGIYFFRFLRLALISAVLYFLIFWLHRWMFDWLESLTRDMTREWSVLWSSLSVYLLTAFLLTLVHMSFGYAKIATVVENRRVMLLAALRGFGFVLSFPGKTIGLYYGLVAVGAIMLALYSVVAPGAGQSNYATIFLAFVIGQLFLIAKLIMRLTLYGAQTSLFKALASR
jgi:hypothetical protein